LPKDSSPRGVRMLLKVGPLTALGLSAAALSLLALGPYGWRLGWWSYRFGLAGLMPSSALVAVLAVILSVVTFVRGRTELNLGAIIILSVAFVVSAALVCVPLQFFRLHTLLPPMHDITTDTDNPPMFSAVLPARAAEHARSVCYRDPRVPQLQNSAYPDVAPVMTPLSVASAFDMALQLAQSMPGWTIVASDAKTGRIEANQQSRWFRFTDDIVIRVTGDETGSRIDMRSTSRQGRGDFGVNAARVRAYMGALRQRIG
jgi:uncharacterized protein (DUF1499 family)